MLSRVAEALFWIGRYVERAEDTARLLDVHFHEVLEDPSVDEAGACAVLLTVMGVPDETARRHRDNRALLELLGYDEATPNSIVGALVAARQNARGAREALSAETWECLNSTYNSLPTRVVAARDFGPAPFFSYVRERAATFAGYAEASMSRDSSYDVLVLGRSLERVDMTARLLAARIGAGEGSEGWTSTLRACSAHEAYLRTYQQGVEAPRVLEFLLVDRLFPRSVFHALSAGENALARLDPAVRAVRTGRTRPAGDRPGPHRSGVPVRRQPPRRPSGPAARPAADRVDGQRRGDPAVVRRVRTAAVEPRGARGMSWRIAVRHRTGYKYAGPVRASYNEARLTPPSLDGQRTLGPPSPSRPRSGRCATSTTGVRRWTRSTSTSRTPSSSCWRRRWSRPPGRGPRRPAPTGPTWPTRPSGTALPSCLPPSTYVAVEPELGEVARSLRAGSTPVQAGLRAAAWTHETLRYERGATHVHTSSAEARAEGKGVCQDFAHVTLALLRALGLPARYVSGYLHPTAGAKVGETTAAESHAWVEFWAGHWVAVDPTSLADVGSRHVLLARGRDYADVRPLSGVYSGPAAAHFGVTVELTRLG